MKKTLSVLLLCLIVSAPAWAWGKQGHRIVCALAYEYVNKNTRTQIDQLLGKRGIIYYAAWADEIRSDTIYPYSYDWHFQDLDSGMSDSVLVAKLSDYPEVGGNLFRALDSLYTVLDMDNQQVDALKFFVHLVGDRFCPMHTAHLEDMGGNNVRIKWFGQSTNLHKIWDDAIIDFQGFSYTEYVTYLKDCYGDQKKAIEQQSRADELRYNYQLTEQIYQYQDSWNGNAHNYAYTWKEKLDYQLYCAGVKLAQSLNELYGRKK